VIQREFGLTIAFLGGIWLFEALQHKT